MLIGISFYNSLHYFQFYRHPNNHPIIIDSIVDQILSGVIGFPNCSVSPVDRI